MTEMLRPGKMTIGLLCGGSLLVAACQTPQVTRHAYSMRPATQQDPSAMFDWAQAALVDLGYRIDHRDRGTGVLEARSLDRHAHGPARSHALRLSAQRPTRRVVRVRIEPTAQALRILCRVLVQEQVTEAHRIVARDVRGLDTPGETPIDRDAATTLQQNTVWRTLRRDQADERAILSRIFGLSGAGETSPCP